VNAHPNPAPEADDPARAGYAAALAELESILRELEGSDVDVDRLADRVARAAQLITFCRDRIGSARLQIDHVLADLDAAAPPSGPSASSGSVDASPAEPT
jgi:exodeoxyribonuclease VII small subunit